MINEIGGGVSLSSAQGLDYSVGASSGNAKGTVPALGQQSSGSVREYVDVGRVGLSILASGKDNQLQTAVSIRAAGAALDKVGATLDQLQQKVAEVKNYPPYPMGDDRAQYIRSLAGLRKELEELTVPRVASDYKPVFYPRKSDLPQLDPHAASDEQVHVFGQAVGEAQARLGQGYAELQVQSEQIIRKINTDIPQPKNAADAKMLGEMVSRQLAETTLPLVGGGNTVAQLGA